MKIKWYEYRNPYTGEHYWWTQRDKNGNCFEVRPLEFSERFRLLINECKVSDHDTLIEAQKAAEAVWVSELNN